ncbi:hypothetical protein J0A67_10825 [Algoriphagus aestuariicola]|jgi:hypothetical protein|uniref:Uncharacterized protein n=1 Tax=Algoriphagus aestuariicola TaxID=1852016 RepID=A0ABS3BPW7_9BACT|nr:hypothetical protein [Algoriphagus aestuariicola]MBN7801357.1 hypothetical protein [Algoriphagus aestuariicola]
MKTFRPSHQNEFSLYSFTGTTEESGKSMETQVYGGGGGGGTYQGTGGTAPVSISSRTIVHDQLFLVSLEGKERAFQLQDFNLAARKGNRLSVFWGIPSGKDTGHYIAVKNHSTDQVFYHDKEVSKLFLKSWLQGILLAAGVVLLLSGVLGGAGLIYTALGGGALFFAWKRWDTAKKEIANFKAEISSFSGE